MPVHWAEPNTCLMIALITPGYISSSTRISIFNNGKTLFENQSGRKLKVLHTDNGGEYTSSRFEEFLKGEHECTIPKTPEQNGTAERMNRTVVEMVCSMLIDSKLPQKFWGEALSTVVYLTNRSPTKAVEGMKPGQRKSHKLDSFVFLGVTPTFTSPRTKGRSWILKPRNAFLLDMERKPRVIDCTT